MSCASCAVRIETNLLGLPGVSRANVNFATNRASVSYDSAVTGPRRDASAGDASRCGASAGCPGPGGNSPCGCPPDEGGQDHDRRQDHPPDPPRRPGGAGSPGGGSVAGGFRACGLGADHAGKRPATTGAVAHVPAMVAGVLRVLRRQPLPAAQASPDVHRPTRRSPGKLNLAAGDRISDDLLCALNTDIHCSSHKEDRSST